MNKIRFAITGSGFMGRTHAEAIRRLDRDATLVALWGGSRAPALAERYGAACEPTLEALLARPDIDALVVTTPHHRHLPEALMALERGKHVLIEKPMAISLDECDRLMAAAQRSGALIGVGYHPRFRRNTVRARELIQAGAIGQVLTAQVSMPMYRAAATAQFGGTWAWWDQAENVGHLLNTAPHATDLMSWLTGSGIAQISAFCRTFAPGMKVEDTTLALMEFTNGTLFSFYSSNVLPVPAFPGEDFRFRLVGTKGLMDIAPVGELRLEDDKGWRVENVQVATNYVTAEAAFGDTRMQCYCDQMQAFLDGIRGQPLRCGSAADGRAAVAACLAMLTSSKEKRWVQP